MKTHCLIISFFFIFSVTSGEQVPDSLKIKSLPPAQFQAAYQNSEKGIMIDVREFFEYRKSRLKDAVNIPSMGDLDSAADTIDKHADLFFYCTSGFRSKRVAKYFYEKGFLNVYSLDGGIISWRKAKYPVVKKRLRR